MTALPFAVNSAAINSKCRLVLHPVPWRVGSRNLFRGSLGNDALCPLCQQPLSEGEARLKHFEKFIKQEAEMASKRLRKELFDKYEHLKKKDVSLGISVETYEEIGEMDEGLVDEIKKFEKRLIFRKEAILKSIESNEWSRLEYDFPGSLPRINEVIDRMNKEVDSLEKASDEKARAGLQKQFVELDARFRMRQFENLLKEAVEKFKHQDKLDKCMSAVKTTDISKKAGDLSRRFISEELKEAINREFVALGVDGLSVSIESRSQRGKWLHKLKMDFQKEFDPGDILSEGEQRAVAIGSFLAEVKLSGKNGGVIFDDPVSSLDHRRRGAVAKRLVEEAKVRQVIVFTHDLYFLCLLLEEANSSGVEYFTQSLRRASDGFGVADSELPFEGGGVKQRLGVLKDMQQRIDKLCRDGDEKECRRLTVEAYCKLRTTWERAVEEVLLCEVILRFRKGVETQRLSGVVVDDNDYSTISRGMKKCSNYAHDRAFMGDVDVPSPRELLGDINEFEEWRNRVLARTKETSKKRKSCSCL